LDPFKVVWPYLVIIGGLFFTGIGIPPLPEELAIIGAGIAASHQEVWWFLAWPSCIVGVVAADLVLYWAGRWWGTSLFRYRWVQRALPEHRRLKIEEGFRQNGVKILLSARLLPGLRTGVFLTAGAMRYPFLRFLIADGVYAIPGTGFIFFGAYFLAEAFILVVNQLHKVQYWLLGFALLAAGGYALYRYFRVAKEHAEHDDLHVPSIPELVHSRHPRADAPDGDKAKTVHPHATPTQVGDPERASKQE
jgi:membrane protein DedA with SNARE-associated domain